MTKRKLLALFTILPVLLITFGCSLAKQHASLHKSSLNSPLQAVQAATGTPGTYRFIAFGDWGAGTKFQKDVAQQAIQLYEKTPYDAVLMLGDNIYETGDVKKLGKAYFTDVYGPLIQNHVHFIVALGNHDVLMHHQADELAFFKMPGYYYTVHKPQLDIFVINSNSFAKDKVQQQWLKRELSASKAPWKIVMGHHPIYSSGEHGYNPELHKTLEPLLIQNKVDLYLAGHDHDYERFQPVGGVQHIVSGGGGAYLRDFEEPFMPGSLVRAKKHHFLSFELKGNTLHMWVIDKTGQVIDQAHWEKVPQAQLQTGLGDAKRS